MITDLKLVPGEGMDDKTGDRPSSTEGPVYLPSPDVGTSRIVSVVSPPPYSVGLEEPNETPVVQRQALPPPPGTGNPNDTGNITGSSYAISRTSPAIQNNSYSYSSPPTSGLASFARQAPNQIYPSFDPIFLVSTRPYLTHGFLMVPPPSHIHPHPFVSHDVTESDWLKFLQEIKQAGELTQRQEDNARLPIINILPIVGTLTTHVIRQQMKKGKTKDVTKIIDLWNHHFFRPRHLDVVLMQGRMRISGLNNTPSSFDTPFFVPEFAFDNGKGKDRSKEEDTKFRLYVLPMKS